MFDDYFFQDMTDLSATDIAGVAIFEALIRALRSAENSNDLTGKKRKVVLRQIAKQAQKISDRYRLDHMVDLESFIKQ